MPVIVLTVDDAVTGDQRRDGQRERQCQMVMRRTTTGRSSRGASATSEGLQPKADGGSGGVRQSGAVRCSSLRLGGSVAPEGTYLPERVASHKKRTRRPEWRHRRSLGLPRPGCWLFARMVRRTLVVIEEVPWVPKRNPLATFNPDSSRSC